MIELTAGTTTTPEQAQALHAACRYPQPDWQPGSAEPWIADLLASLLVASGQTTVLELGGYKGQTSQILQRTLSIMGGGRLTVVEHNPLLAELLKANLYLVEPSVLPQVLEMDALEAIQTFEDRSIGFVWVDDTHFADHVNIEIQALLPKMKDGGLLCFHDVHGSYQLHHLVSHYGGYALDLPSVSTAGGLGILQVTPDTRQITPPTVSVRPDGPDYIVTIRAHHPESAVETTNVSLNPQIHPQPCPHGAMPWESCGSCG